MIATPLTVDGRAALRLERRFGHSIERVWRAVTEPESSPAGSSPRCRGRPSAGEEFEAAGAAGRITEFEPPRLIAWTWDIEGYSFELTADGDGCVLVFTHVFNPEYGPDWQHAAGWETYFDRLDAHVAGGYLSEEDAHERSDELKERYRRAFASPRAGRERVAGVRRDVEQRPGVNPHRERQRRADHGDHGDLELARVNRPAERAATVPGTSSSSSTSGEPPAIAGRPPGVTSGAGAGETPGATSQTAATTRR